MRGRVCAKMVTGAGAEDVGTLWARTVAFDEMHNSNIKLTPPEFFVSEVPPSMIKNKHTRIRASPSSIS